MHTSMLAQLTDTALLAALHSIVARDRATTAELLAHIAEVDARRLYLPAGYSSMHAYCVEALHLSDDSAYKRIQAARAARRFPALFAAVADGRLHLAAVCLIAPHVTPQNCEELVAAATHRRKAEIERWLWERFVGPSPLAVAPRESVRLAPGQVVPASTALAPGQVESPAPARARHIALPPATYDKLRHARALLGHALPSGDDTAVIDRALAALITQLEKRKSAATGRPRRTPPAAPRSRRTVPAHVKRAVWRRDEARCAFVSADGHRCATRARLEFDHVDPVARGGRPEPDRMRLLCRAHNQYEAERVFGAEFMRGKRPPSRRGVATQAPTCPGASSPGS